MVGTEATNAAPCNKLRSQERRSTMLGMLFCGFFIWLLIEVCVQQNSHSDFFTSASIDKFTQTDASTGSENATKKCNSPKSNNTEVDSRFIRNAAEGVDRIYLDLLREAERRAAIDFESSHKRGDRGVVIGPTDGNFKYTLKALQNARRIRYILGHDHSVKIALMTSKDHVDILTEQCSDTSPGEEYIEACRLWANGTLLDDVIIPRDYEFQGNDDHTNVNQGSSNHQLKELGGYRLAPYTRTMYLDSDAYPCPKFKRLFDFVTPPSQWQMPTEAPVDLAIGLEQFWHKGDFTRFFTPGDERLEQDFENFRMRNTGTVLFHFHSITAHTFAHFLPLVAEHVFNNVATTEMKVPNDQHPFRVALYLFNRLVPEFNEQHFPMHSSCRSYPGTSYAGTDGFKNGMFPVQQDGNHCNECSCTPCMVVHTKMYDVYINGKMGWEEELDGSEFSIRDYLGTKGY